MPELSTQLDRPLLAANPAERALRGALDRLTAGDDVAGTQDWEAFGTHLLALATRDAQDWRSHRSEYIGAYVAEVIALLRRRPELFAAAPSPWGLVVAKGRLAGRYAVGVEALGGLTGRDAVNHRVRLSTLPRVVSLDSLAERGATV